MGLSGKIGYNLAMEYKTLFLIQNNLISGCCTPPDFILFDKLNGKLKSNIGRLIYYSDDKTKPFSVGFADSNFNSVALSNFDTGKEFIIKLPKGQIELAIKQLEVLAAEELFEETHIKDKQLVLTYRYEKTAKGNYLTKSIVINVSKYSH